jgi:predicted transport protein
MDLFKINNNKVEEVNLLPFKLERDIQNLVEENTTEFFDLDFISSELTVGKYRIDSLCFDSENNSFVIIEYKKGSSYSVIDQGYTYLQLLLNNKSDFLLVLSQHLNKVLKLEDVDWSHSRIIFVSPSFNSYQKDSVNFKGLPFELWEIKRFTNNTIVFNKHKSSSNESIESINSTKNKSLISSVSKEVKVYSVEQHISKLSDQMVEKWEELNSKINELEGIELNPKKHYISLALDGSSFSTICYIKFGKSKIKLSIIRGVENYFSFDDPKGIAGDWQRILNNGKTQKAYEINIDSKSDLDYIIFLVKQKFKSLTE